MNDKYDLNYMAFAKHIGLWPTKRGKSYRPPDNLSARGLLDLGLDRYYDLNPHLPRPAKRWAA